MRLLLGAAEADLKNGEVEAALSAGTQALAPYERMRLPVGLWGSLAESGVYLMRAEWRLWWLRSLPGRSASEVHSATHYLFHRLSVVLSSFDLLRSMVLASRSLALALSHGSDEDIVDALALYSVFIGMRRGKGNLKRAERLMVRCIAWRAAVKDPELDIWIDESSAILCVLTGDFRQAREKLPICLERYRSLGRLAGVEIVSNLSYQALAEAALGKPKAGIEYLRSSLAHALSARDLFFLRSVIPTATWMHVLVGDLSAATALASETPEEAKSASNPTSMPLIYYEAALALAKGDHAGAITRLEKLLSAPLQNGLVFFGEPRIRSHLLLGAAFLAESRRAPDASLQQRALRRARAHVWKVLKTGDPTLEGIAFRMAGLIEAAQGAPKAARRWLDRAVLSLEHRGEAVELAAALLARGFLASSASDIERGSKIIAAGSFMDPAAREGGVCAGGGRPHPLAGAGAVLRPPGLLRRRVLLRGALGRGPLGALPRRLHALRPPPEAWPHRRPRPPLRRGTPGATLRCLWWPGPLPGAALDPPAQDIPRPGVRGVAVPLPHLAGDC